MLPAPLAGFLTSLSLILAIGAQNMFVLRQGLVGRHVFWLCLFCAASDAILISAGVAGFGLVSSLAPVLTTYLTIAGSIFLFVYGALRFRASWIGDYDAEMGASQKSLSATIALAAAFTWGNPHVYLDTVALLGAASTAYSGPGKVWFGTGAVVASFVFFFSLGYGSRSLAKYFTSAKSWRVLDAVVGAMMWVIAAALIMELA